ncbi:YobI family P-loop NTPase [Leucobacter sp. M11]|uniref:YobI family P-loop NTPase n=1 Tax=Leucobacter sp. M11 TaxID=2993565 RepID=UPI002D80E824|nr:hypothetical protein [Leucobacter sp. M11]
MPNTVNSETNRRAVQQQLELTPLTPKYLDSSHKIYFDAIEVALAATANLAWWNLVKRWTRWRKSRSDEAGKLVRNIALTGGYGVGKSSVLQEVSRRHARKVVSVSLSTLGAEGEAQPVDESSHADKVDDKTKSISGQRESGRAQEGSTTNQIQKEIVKQLLYREDPVKMPGSRFRRIGRFKRLRALGTAALIAIVLVFVFYLTGWTAQLAQVVEPRDFGLWIHLMLWGIFALISYLTLALMHNRLQIHQVKVADTDISLDKEAVSFFDQYLDEIVYFFDITKRDIVIFEDIDRFDDPYIFETLRALNTLLNNAGQLRGRRIRFIYAIKDSIFIKIGKLNTQADQDSIDKIQEESANRTKFFDLVVPVVPFITHRNARNLMDDALADIKGAIDPKLIDLAARHITDMRLIKNVRNEFIVFKDKIFKADDNVKLDLNDNSLFAMMLYKGTHLADFEKIKTRTSNLDSLYDSHDEIITFATDELDKTLQEKRSQLTQLAAVSARSKEFGDALVEYAKRVGRHIGSDPTDISVVLGGVQYSEDEVLTQDFWLAFAGSDSQIDVNLMRNGSHYGQIAISKADAKLIFDSSVSSAENWKIENRATLRSELQAIGEERSRLAYADWDALFESNLYKNKDGSSFGELANCLGSDLAKQLVAEGYIGRDFTLYTSSYYSGRVSTRAQNFLMHCVDRNVMQPSYDLGLDDVKAIIQDRGDTVLREHGMYNVSVVDYLLMSKQATENEEDLEARMRQSEILVRSLMYNGNDEQSFFASYFSKGIERDALVRMLSTQKWLMVFDLIVSRSELSIEEQVGFFNTALEAMVVNVDYLMKSDVIRRFIETNAKDLQVLATNSLSVERAECIAHGFSRAEVKLASLSGIGKNMRIELVKKNAYRVTRENLQLALPGNSLALDEIHNANVSVYEYVVQNLQSYLETMQADGEAPHLIVGADSFALIVADIAENYIDLLPEVLAGANQHLEVGSLTRVPASTWSTLASNGRFPMTFDNLTAYSSTFGEIDTHLGALLEKTLQIITPDSADQSARVELAGTVLGSKETIPEPESRVSLVKSLNLDAWLPLTSVPSERGTLVGLLMEHEIIEDNADSYALLRTLGWESKEFAICKSPNFTSYATSDELPIEDIPRLLESKVIPQKNKLLVLERADEFIATDDRPALSALATYSLSLPREKALSVELIARMAKSGVDGKLLSRILEPVLSQIDINDLSGILESMGSDYAAVSKRNGRRPRLPKTDANLALIRRLEALSIVSSHTVSEAEIKVNMRQV